VDRVELEQVGSGLRIARDLVDVSELKVSAAPGGSQPEAAHPPEAVDPDARHA
jgi:hypothetical protein